MEFGVVFCSAVHRDPEAIRKILNSSDPLNSYICIVVTLYSGVVRKILK